MRNVRAAASLPLVLLLGGRVFAAQDPGLEKSGATTRVTGSMDKIPREGAPLKIEPMNGRERFSWYLRHSFDAGSLLVPLLPAAIIMADPPRRYPHSWRAGGAAFGRNFGDCLTTELAADTGRYLAGWIAHEDPRYYPDRSRNAFHRVAYALAFTLVDRSGGGRPMIAASNLAGSASAGLVGRAYLPSGYNDTVHALQRAGGTLGGYVPTLLVGYATGNLVEEFSPELKRLGRKLHLPFVPKS